jgi:purine-binding chemotaxis protein CheW
MSPQEKMAALTEESLATKSSGRKKYLSFRLGQQLFSVPLACVTEVIAMPPVTGVPGLPQHFLGLVNLRGNIIPIMDLKARFGWPKGEERKRRTVLITEVSGEQVGILVDEVLEVVPIEVSSLDSSVADSGEAKEKGIISANKRSDGSLTLILDLMVVAGLKKVA